MSTNVFSEINSYQPQELPVIPPELVEFRNMSKFDQNDKREKFFRQDFVQEYLEAKWKVELYNRDTFLRLHELLTDNAQNAEVVGPLKIKLEQFKCKINQNPKPFEALRLDWGKYPL